MSLSTMRRIAAGDGPPYYVFDALAGEGGVAHGVTHAVFTRQGGASAPPFASLNVSSSIGDDPGAVATNRGRVMAALGRPRAGLIMAGLVHGTTVARVDGTTGRRLLPNSDRSVAAPLSALASHPSPCRPLDGGGYWVVGVDALVTDDPSVTLVVTAADCAQVFLVDPRRRAVGLAHAGWRGTVAGVLTAAVQAMQTHFGSDPADLQAAVGPCLGPCCARFSDPRRELPAWCAPFIHGDHVDLWAMNRQQLLDAGLRAGQVTLAGVCTVCRRDLFFSHRGDGGRTGRFAAAIAIS